MLNSKITIRKRLGSEFYVELTLYKDYEKKLQAI